MKTYCVGDQDGGSGVPKMAESSDRFVIVKIGADSDESVSRIESL